MAVVWLVWAAPAGALGWFIVRKFWAHPVLVSTWWPEEPVPALEARQVMPLPAVVEPTAVIPPDRRELGQ